MPRDAKDAGERQKQRHQPLLRQLQDEGRLKSRSDANGNGSGNGVEKNGNGKRTRSDEEGLLDARTSRQILQLAKEQVNEDHAPLEDGVIGDGVDEEEQDPGTTSMSEEEEEEDEVDVEDVSPHEQSQQFGETLADKIMRKIEAQSDSLPSTPKVHPKVVLVYSK